MLREITHCHKKAMYGQSKAKGNTIKYSAEDEYRISWSRITKDVPIITSELMLKPTFLKLRDFLLEHTPLRGCRGVDIEEKLGIFLHMVSRGTSQRDASEFFERSKSTIAACFDQVLKAMVIDILHAHEVQLPDPDNPAGFQRIQESKKFFPFFKDCLGAIDGTYIYSYQGVEKAIPFRNRKGEKTQKCSCCMYFRPAVL
jgi:hypothetical protein